MPMKIRYVKRVGKMEQGAEEMRSDIDANILVAMGVAAHVIEEEEVETQEAALQVEEQEEGETVGDYAPKAKGPRSKKGKKTSKKKKSGEKNEGYRRRDMTAERRT